MIRMTEEKQKKNEVEEIFEEIMAEFLKMDNK